MNKAVGLVAKKTNMMPKKVAQAPRKTFQIKPGMSWNSPTSCAGRGDQDRSAASASAAASAGTSVSMSHIAGAVVRPPRWPARKRQCRRRGLLRRQRCRRVAFLKSGDAEQFASNRRKARELRAARNGNALWRPDGGAPQRFPRRPETD